MSDSKQAILRALRENRLPAVAPPALDRDWIAYADPQTQFIETLAAVGGRSVVLRGREELAAAVEALPVWREARKTCSLVPEVSGNVDLAVIEDPHNLEDLDCFLAPGQFGVAENAAIWVTDEGVRQRAAYFITQHLALVLPAGQILHHLHEAYQRLTFSAGRFGVLISGPSKTADIEQSLVIGAHGARSLTVFLVPETVS
jgi:L-lactate dehydrogenase complex protein LldG